jgi:hypothetical protein
MELPKTRAAIDLKEAWHLLKLQVCNATYVLLKQQRTVHGLTRMFLSFVNQILDLERAPADYSLIIQ